MTATRTTPGRLDVDQDLIEAISARLDLRQPNKEALFAIAARVSDHYDLAGKPPPFEGVVDVATGVGKTYVAAAVLEYFAARGHRHFAVITPGRTILDKTVANFTAGNPKSLLGGMDVDPLVVTTENFAAADHAEEERVKLYVFTVQSLIRPTAKQGRKTRTFQESLGEAFYEYLRDLDDLVVFADEHHVYYGPAFSDAIRELKPYALIGLTATPHKKTEDEELIYRYPLAAAIADRLVKTPVLVGRHDDRTDVRTKLQDGLRLLEAKRQAVERYCELTGKPPVNPIMLVIAQTIEDADAVSAELAEIEGGRYEDGVLTIHSKAPDEALAKLETVEQDENVHVIVSVGMLKEGWDVKNVYVICSLRALVAEILTEQTLGRGLRLPFGEYTDVELLDTLEVLAHERYEALLKKTGVINEAFVDYRTFVRIRQDSLGDQSVETERRGVDAPVGVDEAPGVGQPVVEGLEERERQAQEELTSLAQELRPRNDVPGLRIPRIRTTTIKVPFSLADITDLDRFESLGRQLATTPDDELRRMQLGAEVVETADGFRSTVLVTRTGERIVSEAETVPLAEAREKLVDSVLGAPVVPGRLEEQRQAERLVDAFLAGLGDEAERVLSAFADRAAARLVRAVTEAQRDFQVRPTYDKIVEVEDFQPVRIGRPDTTSDLTGKFRRGVGYTGWQRSLYDEVWFDSSTEREVALILDNSDSISFWTRLLRDDLAIRWQGDDRDYNPDFIAVEADVTHWVVEAKATKDIEAWDVKGKENAALRWASHVSAKTDVAWRYLLVSEDDVAAAHGSWTSLKKLGRGS